MEQQQQQQQQSQPQSSNALNNTNNNSDSTSSVTKPRYTAAGFQLGISEDRNKRCRRTMEDAHTFVFDFMGIPRQGFFAIFDGHAGKATAEFCGANFDKILANTIKSSKPEEPTVEVLNKAFLAVDDAVNQREGKTSGCTAVVAFVKVEEGTDKRTLYVGNVGDARAVLSRQNKAVRLSYDHKGSDSQEAQRIVKLGGFMMNNRVNGVLAVTRSLGDSVMKEFVVGNPYTTETELGPDDDFLILACDGLWDVCEDQDAINLIKDIKDPQAASQKLLEHALANFSTDNLSIMVIRLASE
ncbi:phosphatase 2C-like domain-containing protein [Mycotypha africana]|uniref:phosphatase 2C-like domain-containing protein n=1 Tax=Mycotypha africana TaxID=64632 RepID=UPI002300283C|nr:phosphatase 2C-like domain-containing protein [Mycotypha africana]KAI8967416.1 phosphatase 2C-like domain-containing protein [Mycotypha africana]